MEKLDQINQVSFNILSIPDSLVYKAIELQACNPVSYTNYFALTYDLNLSTTLVTGHPDFEKADYLITNSLRMK